MRSDKSYISAELQRAEFSQDDDARRAHLLAARRVLFACPDATRDAYLEMVSALMRRVRGMGPVTAFEVLVAVGGVVDVACRGEKTR